MNTDFLLCIFVKFPRPGHVKTRLGAEIGHGHAADIYRRLAENCVNAARGSGLRFRVAYSGPEGVDAFSAWLGSDLDYVRQEGSDLGDRLRHCFADNFRQTSKIAIIGSDIPQISSTHIRLAADNLQTSDYVIGPALDGGYYLIGCRKDTFNTDIFNNIRWSGPTVLSTTLANLHHKNNSVKLLETLFDIDTADDLRKSPMFNFPV